MRLRLYHFNDLVIQFSHFRHHFKGSNFLNGYCFKNVFSRHIQLKQHFRFSIEVSLMALNRFVQTFLGKRSIRMPTQFPGIQTFFLKYNSTNITEQSFTDLKLKTFLQYYATLIQLQAFVQERQMVANGSKADVVTYQQIEF